MNAQERQIIDGLFDKIRDVERQAGPREPAAEAHIRSRLESQPAAPYFMAQTIVMQEQALQAAQARIEELQRPAAGGILSGLFGGGSRQPAPSRMPQYDASSAAGMGQAQQGRGGFLAGAAQTAMGVAGGMFLGSMIGSAFGGGEANATEAAAPEPEPAADDGAGFGDFGGDP